MHIAHQECDSNSRKITGTLGLSAIPEIFDDAFPVIKVGQAPPPVSYEDRSPCPGDLCHISSLNQPNERQTSASLHRDVFSTRSASHLNTPPALTEQPHCPPDQLSSSLGPLTSDTGLDSNYTAIYQPLASIYFWGQKNCVYNAACLECKNLREYEDSKKMRITRKSAHSSGSTISTKSSDADTLVRGGEGASYEKVSWPKMDVDSALNLGSSQDKTTIMIKEELPNLVHDKVGASQLDCLQSYSSFKCSPGQIQDLREITGTLPIYLKPVYRNPFTHPDHLRRWHNKNLWCAYCEKRSCAVCDAPCCVFFGAWKVHTDASLPPIHREWAQNLSTEIKQWMPVGCDEETFMYCTTCHRYVCPSCCGICPRYPCYDRVCKGCKPEPWKPCDFHSND